MNLVILTHKDQQVEDRYKLRDKRADHVLNILRAQVGDTIKVGLVNGPVGSGLIECVSNGEIVLQCHWDQPQPPRGLIVDLICALPRPQTLKKVLISCATMAVRRIHLVRANRTQKSYFDSTLMQKENFTPYLLEGLSQGMQTRLPEVYIHKHFRPFFEDTLAQPDSREDIQCLKLLADVDSDKYLGPSTLAGCKRVMLAIGPEGGWVPFEADMIKSLGFEPFKIGPWTLRVEQAVVAAISQIELARQA